MIDIYGIRQTINLNRRYVIAGRKAAEEVKYTVRSIDRIMSQLEDAADEIDRLTHENARLQSERDMWERNAYEGRR